MVLPAIARAFSSPINPFCIVMKTQGSVKTVQENASSEGTVESSAKNSSVTQRHVYAQPAIMLALFAACLIVFLFVFPQAQAWWAVIVCAGLCVPLVGFGTAQHRITTPSASISTLCSTNVAKPNNGHGGAAGGHVALHGIGGGEP
jgi:hypothetical protein